MLTYLLAFLAACANAAASVLQRTANRREPGEENLSLRLVRDLLHQPVWFGGILAVIVGFLLQAAALGDGEISVVEPILVLELPLTLLLGAVVFGSRLRRREWGATVLMTAGLAGLLWFLSPTGGSARDVGAATWAIGIGASLAVIGTLVALARREDEHGPRRAMLLGVATGAGFGLTAALMKGMTTAYAQGFAHLFASWQLYAMVVAGAGSMFLLQSALNAGRLVAAQPGITLSDPVVSILWGVLGFSEVVRGGIWAGLAVVAAVAIAVGAVLLAGSPLVNEEEGDEGPDPEVERPREDEVAASPG